MKNISKNYIQIQGWMVSELGLSGNELLCYALIYGFSQDEQSVFSGSSSYIATWLNIDKRNVLNVLKRLVEKGFIIKKEKIINNVKLCDYQAILPGGDETTPAGKNNNTSGDETTPGVVMKRHQGGDETTPHNIQDNIPDNIYKKKIIIKKENETENESEDVKVGIDEGFNFGDCLEVRDIANKYKLNTLDAVHKFLCQNFMGQWVDVSFISKLAAQFDSRMIKQEV